MKKILLVVLFSVFLFGCNEESKANFYFMHPRFLEYKLHSCDKLSMAEFRQSDSCQLAFAQAHDLQEYSKSFIASQTDFGEAILRTQMKVSELEKQLANANNDTSSIAELTKQITELQTEVKKRLFVISLYMSF